jgi:hypothetical protein
MAETRSRLRDLRGSVSEASRARPEGRARGDESYSKSAATLSVRQRSPAKSSIFQTQK